MPLYRRGYAEALMGNLAYLVRPRLIGRYSSREQRYPVASIVDLGSPVRNPIIIDLHNMLRVKSRINTVAGKL